MQCFFKFSLQEFVSPKILSEYLNYKLKNAGVMQKEIVDQINIPTATFTRAKRAGFYSNPKVYYSLIKYFNIKEDYSYLSALENEANILFTYIYYTNAAEQQKCYERLVAIYEKTKDNVLEVLTLALMSIAINTMLYPNDLKLLETKVDLLEHFYQCFSGDQKMLLIYSLYEYALHKKDVKLAIAYGNIIEPLIPTVNEKFEIMMNYAIMNQSFFEHDFLKGIIYANKVIEAQAKHFSNVIRTTAVYALTTFYSMLNDYEKIIATAQNEVLHLQFDEEHQLQYFSMQIALATAYMMKEDYELALETINVIQVYDFSKHEKLNKAYIPMLIDRQKMTQLNELFINYKLKNLKRIDAIFDQISKENNPERLEYAKIILLLLKGNKSSLKQVGSFLDTKAQEKMLLAYSNIHYAIKREYQKLKYEV